MPVISREEAIRRGMEIIEPKPPKPELPGTPSPISGPTPGWKLPVSDEELLSIFHGLKLLSAKLWTESGLEVCSAVATADLLRRIQPAVVQAVKRIKPPRAVAPDVVVSERVED